MRILLIYPWHTHGLSGQPRWYPVEPLGILSVATFLKEQEPNAQVEIYDAQLEGPSFIQKTSRGYRSGCTNLELLEKIATFEPDIIGITCEYTATAQDALEIAEVVKSFRPQAKIVLGGAHATIAHEELINLPYVDYVVRGEGEAAFVELYLCLHHSPMQAEFVPGTTSKKQVNEDRSLIQDLNELPYPDRKLLKDYRRYLQWSHQSYSWPKQTPIATLSTSRGCPFRCIFCSTQKVWGNTWRGRNAPHILREMEELINQYGVREFALQDDQLLGDKFRIQELCIGIMKKGWEITLLAPPGISPALIDKFTLRLMKQAGFYRICFSIDVGTAKSQQYAKKPVKLERMRDLIRYANHLGLYTYATFVIGFPEEELKDITETIRFAWDLGLDTVIFYIAQPHRGSELYDIFQQSGWMEKQNDSHLPDRAHFGTKYLSTQQLEVMRDYGQKAYARYHLKHHCLNLRYFFWELLPKFLRDPIYFLKIVYKMMVDNP